MSLDSIPLEPHFRKARQAGTIEAMELDEGMFQWGLYAAANRLPFLPTCGHGSDVMKINPHLKPLNHLMKTARPWWPCRHLLDVALIHMNRADAQGNGQF